MVPGSRGGSEWGGAAHDPATGVLYINSNESPEIARIQKDQAKIKPENQTVYNIGKAFYSTYCANCHGADRQGLESVNPSLVNLDQRMTQQDALHMIKAGGGKMPPFASIVEGYEGEIISYLFEINKDKMVQKSAEAIDTATQLLNLTAYSHFRDPERRNAIKPPWGTLNAINLNTGEFEWRIPLGNYPELQKEGAPPTGTENWGGPIVTAGGLVFIAATMDKKFRAFDKDSGEMLWEIDLPENGFATPATYMVDGKQYITIAVMGSREEPSGHIMAFALEE
jgi:quinoprotein glucose dehydrogenase